VVKVDDFLLQLLTLTRGLDDSVVKVDDFLLQF
jgi:hypothetical protein